MTRFKYAAVYLFAMSLLFSASSALIEVKVEDQTLAEIDPKIFGQFMEKIPDAEPGPESALNSRQDGLRAAVIELIESMQIPVMRYPGGWMIEQEGYEWTHLIDCTFDRDSIERPLFAKAGSHQFGLDEFLRFADQMNTEAQLTVEIADAVLSRKTIEEAAQFGAAMVAYCNVGLDAELSPEMMRWARLRAENGHPEPYKVPYWQLGNEAFFFIEAELIQEKGLEHYKEQYAQTIQAFIQAMKAVDPSIQIILEAQVDRILPGMTQQVLEENKGAVQYISHHFYEPWGIREVRKNNKVVDPSTLTAEQVWYCWVSTFGMDPETGFSSEFEGDYKDAALKYGVDLAITEWNWNGWWSLTGKSRGDQPPSPRLSTVLGSANFIHKMFRSASYVTFATQSMLLSQNWEIGAIGVTNDPSETAFMRPTGSTTKFYRKYSGNKLLQIEATEIPYFKQPFAMELIAPQDKVAYLDIVATLSESKDSVFVHIINRHLENSFPVSIDLSDLQRKVGSVTHHQLTGDPLNYDAKVELLSEILPNPSVCMLVEIPPHGISFVEFQLNEF
jgi:alpha-N-arabinofuranosidase